MSDAGTRPGKTVDTEVVVFDGDARASKSDRVVTEEPLEIRLVTRAQKRTLAITMRTPGNDFELAAGFLYGEGVVRAREEIAGITYCLDDDLEPDQRYNVVNVELAHESLPDLTQFERHFVTSSACGVCGRAHLDALRERGIAGASGDLRVPADVLYELPERMRAAQRVFASTGGLHAAALFDERGEPQAVREDVGRHNALDKIVGWALIEKRLPLQSSMLMVSGRASYEILQKSAVAGIPLVASVSAPSSLAVDVAREFGITLAGFVRDRHANVYSAPERIYLQNQG